MDSLEIQLADPPADEDARRLAREVRAFNRAVAGHEPPRPFAFLLREAAGELAGGVHGSLWGRAVHVDALWVAERHRGRGHATALLRRLEAHAAARGHTLAYVETLSYQARPFYERNGYRVFGELEGIAEGCTYYFLRKDLDAPAPT